MFQDNPLLAQLKQQLHSQTPRAEGVVKATEKGFGFLEVDAQKSYFIPPPQMKKVMHGDRIVAVIHTEKERESAEPEELIEPFLTRFVGKVQGKNDRLSIVPDHPLLKDAIPCRAARGVQHEFKEGDWAVAEMRRHPLKGDRSFYADLTQYITFADDHFVPWWVTLARHNLEKEAPNGVATEMLDEGLERQDLTALNFVTIDSASTEDMDDALYAEELADGTIDDDIAFFAATIESKAKLVYDNVSDWLENNSTWQPENEGIAQQIRLLHRICLSRSEWRHHHALVFKDRPDYRFVLGEKGEVLDIVAEPRRIANRIVEESMIAANLCAARVLRDKLGFGIYNVHTGFDPANADALAALLKTHGLHVDAEEVLTLEGFCKLRRELDAQPSGFLDSRIRRFQSFAEISTEPGPHFGLGLEAYATWTSPIRKYGDMINHRLLKAVIKGEAIARPQEDITQQMAERRRLNRMAERDVGDWLYARFLNDKAGTNTRFAAEIIDVSRGGMRVRLVDNGAIAFIPAPFLHAVRDELVCSQENGTVQIKGETVYKVTDVIDVTIAEVRMETRSIIARPAA
ncbi:exoribonuclease II [Salmonella enterica subsp. enterica]|nr:exoribonuclease II [Salmonella enterica subsp. enterica]